MRLPEGAELRTKKSAEGQTRTVDTGIFSAVLYHLSYLGYKVNYRIHRDDCQDWLVKGQGLFILRIQG